jgi:predicted ATPase with chaperone activity
MLARRLTTILPAMTLAEAIETTHIHSVAGLTGDRTVMVTTRPCRAPHHTISGVGLIGGGHVSRAHNGVLFWNERPEFRRHVLEVLRQPFEYGVQYIQSRGHPRPSGLGRSRRAYVHGYRVALDAQHSCVAGLAQSDAPCLASDPY